MMWQTKKLVEVCEVAAGNSAPQNNDCFVDGKFPFFRTSDVGAVHLGELRTSVDRLNEKGIKGLKLFPKGTILLPKSGASTFLNHRVIMASDGYVSSHLATIKTNEKKLNNKFLFYLLCEIKAQDLIQDHKYPSLNLSVIENIEISFPPLPEQQRIVALLDEIFLKISKTKENAEKNLQNAKELFESYLQNVFVNPDEDWEGRRLEDVCDFQNGFAFKSNSFKEKGLPILRISNIQNNVISYRRLVFFDKNSYKENFDKYQVKKGDLVIAMSGATTGKLAVSDADEVFYLNQRVGKFLPKKELLKDYLYYLLSTRIEENLKISFGTAQPNLSTEQIKDFQVPLPSVGDQKSIVARLDALSSETKKLEAIYKQKLADLDELKKSVLQKAFAGEL